jgi:alpha-beta hydrolase superfamily lysophospholipase
MQTRVRGPFNNPAVRAITCSVTMLAITFTLSGCKDRIDPRDNANTPVQTPVPQEPPEAQITLKTTDGWTIYGDMLRPIDKPLGAVIMLHQRGGSAADWKLLSEGLRKAGIASLAIDQRGSGRSVGAKSESGDNAPWQTSGDIEAAVKYLKDHNFRGHIGIVGASYGANNALIYAGSPSHVLDVQAISLFSPGADYPNLNAAEAAKTWRGPMQIVYGLHDTVAGLGPQNLRDASPSHDKVIEQFDNEKHGTELLDPETVDSCVVFFSRTLK